jgi:hypothetical protein
MPIGGDSLIEDMSQVIAGVLRRSKVIDFGALYGGTVLFSDGDRATVQPDDERLGPTLAQCRVRRPDGMTTYPVAEGGVRCLIGWEGGDPSKRYCLVGWDGSGTVSQVKVQTSTQVDIVAPLVNLGASPAADFITKQPLVTNLNTLFSVMKAAFTADAAAWGVLNVAAPNPAFATAQTASTAAATAITTWQAALASYSATKVKAT